jgi:hypothetical protein
MKQQKLYADTSIFLLRESIHTEGLSHQILSEITGEKYQPVLSPIVQVEAAACGEQAVQAMETALLNAALAPVAEPALRLREAYLQAGILEPEKSSAALHLATAVAAGCKLLVTWDFEDLLNVEHLHRFLSVNEAWGYPPIGMHCPLAFAQTAYTGAPTSFRAANSQAVREVTVALTLNEEAEYWKKQYEEMLELQKNLKKAAKDAEKAAAKAEKRKSSKGS